MALAAARGPVLLVAGTLAGIAIGERAGAGPARWCLSIGLLLTVVALTRRGSVGLVIGLVAITLLGAASMQRALDGLEHSALTVAVAGHRSQPATVTLVEDPGGSTRFVVDALARARDRTVLVIARGNAAGRLRILSAGDRVSLRGAFRPLSGYDLRARWRHAVGAYEATDVIDASGPSSPLMKLANRMRDRVLAGTASAPATERALLAGLLLGDTRGIPAGTVAQFRAAGLTHHLAVSGENVAFVLALTGPLLRRFGSRGRFVGGLAIIVVFGAMTRWEPSVLRAVAMAGAVMLAALLGRPVTGLRVLALAVGTLLLADPFLVHSVGFLLSCGATAGIALLSRPLAARLPGPVAVRDPLAVTVAAQVGVAPVMIPIFGAVPLASLPANLLAAPLMAPITIGGLIAGAGGGLVRGHHPQLAALIVAPVVLLVRALEGIAAATAEIGLDIDGRGAFGIIAIASAAVALALLRRVRSGSTGRLTPVEQRSATSGKATKPIA